MTSTTPKRQIASAASDFAFQAGQILERTLLEASFELTKSRDESHVSVEMVRATLREDLFERVMQKLQEMVHVGSEPQARVADDRQAA